MTTLGHNPMNSDVSALVESARASGVSLWVEGGRLRFKAPEGALTDEVRAGLRSRKLEVIHFLRRESSASVTMAPLAENQRGMWFLQRLAPSTSAYNVAFVGRIHGGLDEAALNESLQALVDRHESLRTAYPEVEGQPQRRVVGYQPIVLKTVPVESMSAQQFEDRLRADYAVPFDLATGQVLRATLYREAADRHVLMLVAHHIAVDGTSLFVMLEELFESYESILTGRPQRERDLSAVFSDFVDWQASELPRAESARSYWSEVLNPLPPPLDLPADMPRRQAREMSGATEWQEIGPDLTAALRVRARNAGVTDYVLMLSLWFVFLNRLSGQHDITVGTPVQGRPSARFARTVGDFVNTLPMRVKDIANLTFSEVLSRVRDAALQGMTHQDYPLPRMVESVSGGAGEAPFQTLFILQDFSRFGSIEQLMLGRPGDRVRFGPIELSPVPLNQQEGQFELSLDVWPQAEGLRCAWRYDDQLFRHETIKGWMCTFEAAARAVIDSPAIPVAELQILSPDDRVLLDTWNATEQDYPDRSTLHSLIEQQSGRSATGAAVLAYDGGYTYAELLHRAKCIAEGLRMLGVRPGDRVGILMRRGRDTIASLLGVTGAGACYVPLDPTYPEARIHYMLGDSDCAAVITAGGLSEQFGVTLPILDLATFVEPAPAPFTEVESASTAYIIYTSGSTGQPKGVAVPHRALVNFLTAMAREPGIDSTDSVLAVTTISFDIAGLELYLPLTVGARVVLASEDDVNDGPRLIARIRDEGITMLQATPATWKLLIESGWSGEKGLKALCGGEPLPPALADQLCGRVSELWNLYGPTETTVWSTVQRIHAGEPVSIGRPIGNTTLYVLDGNGHRTPIGVPGELWIGGAGVTDGYVNRPALTAERFVESPFRDGERLYRTGDLVRFTRAGALQHLGRLDNQVKVRGYRIELGEVEARLRAHSDVADAVVVARDERLLAYVVYRGREITPETMRRWMSETLPDYMVPALFIPLDTLPLTPNGKVDRKALPDPASRGDTGRQYEAPRNAGEELLAGIWSDVLGVSPIGVFDGFFELGGHSLTATMVASRARDAFGIDLPLRYFFDNPTVAGQAEWFRLNRGGPVIPALTHVESVPDRVPLSFSQERIWFMQEMSRDATAYNIAGAVILRGNLDADRLRRALDRVVERHESLRTRIRVDGGRPYQFVRQDTEYSFHTFDVSNADPSIRRDTAMGHVSGIMFAPYDMAAEPLLRVTLVRLDTEEHMLAVGMHHVISDLWSYGVFARDLATAYNGVDLDAHEPPAVTYRDFTLWQREWLKGDTLGRQLQFWRDRLAGIPTLDLPTDFTRPPLYQFQGDVVAVDMPPALRAGIEALAADTRSTPFMVLLAVLNVLLATNTGQDDIAVGAPIANRTSDAAAGIIGAFINTLVHRNNVAGSATFRDLLARVRATSLDAFSNQDVPLELLVRELDLPRDTSRSPLFQVLFNVANIRVDADEFEGLQHTPVALMTPAAQFDLTVLVAMSDALSEFRFNYNTSLFTRSTAERFVEQYMHMVERAVADPDVSIADLRGVTGTARNLLLNEWNDTAVAFPRLSLLDHVAAVAARRPSALAVESPTGEFTYAELIEYAQQVTAALRMMGVQPGDRVGIVMRRSHEMLGALLGILGTGAAYVPVDPDYPEARIRYMLEDSGAAAVVTHRDLDRRHGITVPVLDLDRWTRPGAVPFVQVAPEQAAYVIYTSGSTGKPKGVEVPHGALVNFLLSMQDRPGIGAGDALLAVTTISFDIAGLELYLPLVTGARVVIAGEDEALDGRRLMRRMDQAGITIMQATPATWKLLIAAGWRGSSDLRVLCGGEPLSRTLADELLDRVAELWNMYGPTETTIWSTIDRVERDSPVLVGRPIANTTTYVLDDALALRPIGVPGELYIGGAGVATGYVNRPDLTAERFIASPFREGERLYRTGDLVRYRHDGRLEHLGRLDSQVKVRGFRIELGEVEAAMQSHAAIRDAVVVATDDRLIAYVVFEPGMHATITDLRGWVGESLPAYMVPSFIVPMDSLPLTPNGKVDRKALPDPAGSTDDTAEWTAPADPAGIMIAGIWSTLLGVERVGVDDNFFEIGGHSLLAMEVVALIEERTGYRPEPRSLFFMTLGELAATIPVQVEA